MPDIRAALRSGSSPSGAFTAACRTSAMALLAANDTNFPLTPIVMTSLTGAVSLDTRLTPHAVERM
jgi:hypothetical protein